MIINYIDSGVLTKMRKHNSPFDIFRATKKILIKLYFQQAKLIFSKFRKCVIFLHQITKDTFSSKNIIMSIVNF